VHIIIIISNRFRLGKNNTLFVQINIHYSFSLFLRNNRPVPENERRRGVRENKKNVPFAPQGPRYTRNYNSIGDRANSDPLARLCFAPIIIIVITIIIS